MPHLCNKVRRGMFCVVSVLLISELRRDSLAVWISRSNEVLEMSLQFLVRGWVSDQEAAAQVSEIGSRWRPRFCWMHKGMQEPVRIDT